MLIGAAKRTVAGRATGVDLWQGEDQAGNSRERTQRNCELEGVAARVAIVDGDARQLPFEDRSFDLVFSSSAIHNIYDAQGRETALKEIIRVLKDGGRMVLIDIRHGHEYGRVLRHQGMENVRISRPNFLFGIASHTVTAQKAKLARGDPRAAN